MHWLIVGIGGFFGAVLRYAVTRWVGTIGLTFPVATLVVNVVGSLFLGFFASWVLHKTSMEAELRLAVQVGFLGALTTFSTFSLDTLNLLNSGQLVKALVNVLLNVCLCLLAVWLGSLGARSLS